MPKDILASQYRGKWVNTPDGSGGVARAASTSTSGARCPYPMFDTFDHPDMNVTAGARHVSTVPTQALTLLNNPFVLVRSGVASPRAISRQASDPIVAGGGSPIASRWRGRRRRARSRSASV